jgi:hypothetical protein
MCQWTNGKVIFLYFAGLLLGISLMLVAEAVSAGAALTGPLTLLVVSLMLPGLPVHAACRAGRRADR